MTSVNVSTAAQWLKSGEAVLIDVREPGEYRAQHIAGSLNLPLGQCQVAALPDLAGRKIILQCAGGTRSGKACSTLLNSQGDLPAYSLAGGLGAWKAAGFPVERQGHLLPLNQQVQLTVGLLVLVLTILGFMLHPYFHAGTALIGLGLINAGLTGWCGMAKLLALMPWNRA